MLQKVSFIIVQNT